MALIPKKNILMILISLISSSWVVYKLYQFKGWPEFKAFFSQNASNLSWTLFLITFLMFLNVSIESIKWRLLASPAEKISLKQSFIQVIKGIQWGLITPARSGEPLGKALFYKSNKRTGIIFLSLLGSFIQNGVIFIFTIISILLAGSSTEQLLNFIFERFMAIDKAAITALFLLIIFLGIVIIWFLRHRQKTFIDLLHSFGYFSALQLIQIIFLTLIRYLLFCFQLLIILHLFEPSITTSELFSVFLFYGVLTFVPSWGSGDLGIRSAIALLIFGESVISGPAIIFSTMLIWIINIALPALIPLFFNKKFNLISTANHVSTSAR